MRPRHPPGASQPVPSNGKREPGALEPPLDKTNTRSYGINNSREAVGWALGAGNHTHALLLNHGHAQDLGVLPGGHVNSAFAINHQGVAVEYSDGSHGAIQVVLWKRGKIRLIGLARCKFCMPSKGDKQPGPIRRCRGRCHDLPIVRNQKKGFR